MLEEKIEKLTEVITQLINLMEQSNKTEVKTAPKPKQVKEVVKPKETVKKAKTLTKEEVVAIARKAVVDFDRNVVKEIIGKYAEKLVDIKETDYEAFVKEIESL